MRFSMMSIAAVGFASVALAAPANLDKRIHGVKTKIVTKTATVTVTEIVYAGPETSTPPPATTEALVIPTQEPEQPSYEPVEPIPTPEPEQPSFEPVEPTPTPTPKPSSTKKPVYTPTSRPVYITTITERAPEPTPTPKPPPSPVPELPSDDGLSTEQRAALDKHNQLRARTGAPPLKWDHTMANYASNHVENCVFEHSSPYKYGENLGAGYKDIGACIQAWFDEWPQYPFDRPDFYPGTGHFTQVVWKAATKVGCGWKTCNGANGTPGTYYSCNYDAGNLIGSFAENVSRPSN